MSDVETPHDATTPHGASADNRLFEQLRRERADFLNYKRRVQRERAEDRERTRQELLGELVPAIDDLDRALDHLPADLQDHPWALGVALAHERFVDALRRIRVERIGQAGEPFDPAVHEAVIYHEDPLLRDQRIQSVMRPGYRVGPRLLRPAQVIVAGPPRKGAHDPHSNTHTRRHGAGRGGTLRRESAVDGENRDV
jgi:molecular chaperone GrpE